MGCRRRHDRKHPRTLILDHSNQRRAPAVVSSVPPEELESVAKQVMGYHTRDQLPFYYGVADEFTLCDRWFCSVLGPTWPNRYYVHSASAGGEMGNDVGLIFRGGLKLDTIYHRLNDAGIPWRYYFADLPFVFTYEAFLKEAGGLLIGGIAYGGVYVYETLMWRKEHGK